MSSTQTKIWHLSYWSTTWQQLPARQRVQFRIIMLIQFFVTLLFIRQQGATFDEGAYFTYVLNWAKGHPERLEPIMDSKTPMVAISLLPTFFKRWLSPGLLANDPFFYIRLGRPFMYVYQLLGCYTVFCWLVKLHGTKKWIIPFLFFCFDPLIFSYSMLVGSDLASASIIVSVLYATWQYLTSGKMKYWWVICFGMAWGVLLKQSLIYFLPLIVVFFIASAFRKKQWNWKKASLQIVQFIGVMLLFINTVYYFKITGTQLGKMQFKSVSFNTIQHTLHAFSSVPVPLPMGFIQGFDWLKHNAELGGCQPESTYKGVYLFGKVTCNQSVWYYYVVVAFFKLPLLVWAMLLFTIILFIKSNYKVELLKKHAYIWFPFFYFIVIISFFNKFQIGIRHLIPVWPFFYIALSWSFLQFYQKQKWIFSSIVLLHCISIMHYWPNIMAYTNELIWSKTKVYNIIGDSSLDYGQTDSQLTTFIEQHPEYKIPDAQPSAGKFAITAGKLATHYPEVPAQNVSWLRNNFNPVGNINYTIILFNITEPDLKLKGLK